MGPKRGRGATVVSGRRAGTDRALLSTRHYSSVNEKLTVPALGARLAKASRVFLASAFYDVEFCEALLMKRGPGSAIVHVLLNGLGGSRLLEQRQCLMDLELRLRKRGYDVEVRLAFEPGIFHTKLLVIESGRNKTALLGSANATMAAMTANEELLVEIGVDERLDAYARRIWDTGVRLDALEERLTARHLIAFLRSGSLYFKPSSSLQVTLNPFAELLASLSPDERGKLGAARLPHSDQESGVGAFNLRRAVGLGDERDDAEVEVKKASIKPFAVETCFGYWVPRALNDELQGKLDEVAAAKRRHLLQFREALRQAGEPMLTRRYIDYVEAVRRLLVDNGVSFSPALDTLVRDPFEPGVFARFLGRVAERLDRDEFVKRLCYPFVPGPMPEIWDDLQAREEFESSFFEFLEFVALRPERRSRVPGRILDRIEAREAGSADATSIKERLVKLLKYEGWAERDWRSGKKPGPPVTS